MRIYCLSTTVIWLHFCLERGLDCVLKGVGLRGGGGAWRGVPAFRQHTVTPTLFDSKCANLFERSMFSLGHDINPPPTHPTGKGGCVFMLCQRENMPTMYRDRSRMVSEGVRFDKIGYFT